MTDGVSSSEDEWERPKAPRGPYGSDVWNVSSLSDSYSKPQETNMTHHTMEQPPSPREPYSAAYQSALDKVYEFEPSDDEDEVNEPSSESADTSAQQQSASSLASAGTSTQSVERSPLRQPQVSGTNQQSNENRQTTTVSVHNLPAPHPASHNIGVHTPSPPVSPYGNNGAVAEGGSADVISDAASDSSQGSESTHSMHSDLSSRSSSASQQHGHKGQEGQKGQKEGSLSDLVSKGVGSELLDCIELPLGYQELDSKVDAFCVLIRKKGIVYPNHPSQVACRKTAKHVITEIRRVYADCKEGIYKCLTKLWLTPVMPGITKIRSLMGIPQMADSSVLGQYIRDAIDSPQLMRVWRHPGVETNSCIFGHQFETLAEITDLETSSRVPPDEADRRNRILKSLRFLLLLLQRQMVDSAMLGFLISLFGTDKCKSNFKKNPKYTTPEGSTIDAKGLFQALLADAVASAFTLDLQRCKTQEALEIGTKANVVCAHLIQEAKVRATLKPILKLVADDDLEGAKRKAENFAQDLQSAREEWEEMEVTQATARIHAALSVSLSFTLSSWKGRLASWVASQTPLAALLRKALGELTSLIFEDNVEAARFGLQVKSVEDNPTVTGGALVKYAQVQVMRSAVEARLFCQTGLKGLGKTLGRALKTVTHSLARAEMNQNRGQSNRVPGPSSPESFAETSSSMSFVKGLYRYPINLLNATAQTSSPSFLSTSFLKKKRRPAGSVMALVGSASGMKLKKALKKLEFRGKRVFADGAFLRRKWWSVIGGIVSRLRTKEKAALPLAILLSIHFFVISLSFAAVATMATQAAGAFCVLVVVLMMLDLLQLDASLNLT
ncbi:hypothetical protein, conserved [Eimeria praecox]|uniref:Uncharacterized protein n=1 Tax=Eimeria praecox TaxID=51316 RepID=U6G482_9EIME|nr:hypothetical protein, conserved [Eimeria praecox]